MHSQSQKPGFGYACQPDPTSFPCPVRCLFQIDEAGFQQNPAISGNSVELAENVRCLFQSDKAGVQQNQAFSDNSVELQLNARCL